MMIVPEEFGFVNRKCRDRERSGGSDSAGIWSAGERVAPFIPLLSYVEERLIPSFRPADCVFYAWIHHASRVKRK
jgi:hypothetical protein